MTSPTVVQLKCPLNSLPCRNSTQCYRQLWACDGIRDCPFADDELGCYHGSNRTLEKGETSAGGDKAKTPYSMELGFLIFVMAGGLLFLLFLWWLCNISVHKRGHRGTGCMEALVADLKDRTWKSDLYDPEDFHQGCMHRSLRQEVTMEEQQAVGNFLYNNPQPFRAPESSTPRCSERLHDQLFLTVDEIGALVSSRHRPAHPPILNLSRPPSYNSCLNSGNAVTRDVMTRGHEDDDVSGDIPEARVQSNVRTDRERGRQVGSQEDAASDLLPSYDEVTRESTEDNGQAEKIPSYPPAYREVVDGTE